MARRATGSVVEHTTKDGRTTRSLRFHAYGKRQFLSLGTVTREHAERELRGILADVERGRWQPYEAPPPPDPEPQELILHALAEQWWVERELEFAPATQADYRWRLENHLLPFFKNHRLGAITVAEVDRFKAAKLAERPPLAPSSINKLLKLLAAILDMAAERELIDRNPALGKRRRVKERHPRRSYLDTAEQVAGLLDAARELDARARADRRHVHRRAMLATLALAGLRIGELLALRWRDVDLASGRLRIRAAKTDAGQRDVTLRPALRDVLADLKAATRGARPDALVFATATGGPHTQTNIRKRVLAPALALADERALEAGCSPLPPGITPHSLRRTFASLLYALGESPAVVMAEMGHTDPALALRIYAQAMRREPGEVERLRAVVEGEGTDRILAPAGGFVE